MHVCRGTIDAISYLAAEAQHSPGDSLLFLTPCHATPLYSHLHRPLAARFLDCSPPGWAPAVACLNGGASAGGGALSGGSNRSGQAGGWSAAGGMQRRAAAEAAAARDADVARCLGAARAQREQQLRDSALDGSVVRSESDRFEQNPQQWLQAEYPEGRDRAMPTHVVLFNTVQQQIDTWLQQHGYRLRQSFFHTHFAVDRGHDARVLIYSL